jgi:hypothetical protein
MLAREGSKMVMAGICREADTSMTCTTMFTKSRVQSVDFFATLKMFDVPVAMLIVISRALVYTNEYL